MPHITPFKCMKRKESISEEAAKHFQYNRRRSAVTEVKRSVGFISSLRMGLLWWRFVSHLDNPAVLTSAGPRSSVVLGSASRSL